MKNKLTLVIILMALAALAYWYFQNQQPAGEAGFPQGNQLIKVSTLVIKTEPVVAKLSLPGRTTAYRQSQVRPQVSGIITERLFKEGALVEQGQQLYQLDDARYAANLKSAQANLMSAKANLKTTQARYNRVKSLELQQAISEQDLDDVLAQLDQAKANISVAESNVELQQINLDYTRVYAPISGRIGKSNLTVGALVTANQAESLAVITQLDPMYVDLQVSGEQAMKVQQQLNLDQNVSVILNDIPGVGTMQGELEFSDVNVDESTGAVALRAMIANPDQALLPGLFVNAELTLGEQMGFLVPQRATTRNPSGELLVWVVGKNKQVNSKIIEVSHASQDQWVVINGLNDNDEIVIEGYQRLSPNAEVETTPWQSSVPSAKSEGA
jgi:membrane fusion protein (multidrug efflux system)